MTDHMGTVGNKNDCLLKNNCLKISQRIKTQQFLTTNNSISITVGIIS